MVLEKENGYFYKTSKWNFKTQNLSIFWFERFFKFIII